MSENTDKENIDTNKGKRDLGKISYSPFNMLDNTVDFPVEEDIKLFTKPYDDIARARRVRAKDLMGVKLYDELSRENSMLARTSRNRFDPLISQKTDQKLNEARLKVQKEVTLPINYDDLHLEYGYRIDILVEDRIILELKTVEYLNDKI